MELLGQMKTAKLLKDNLPNFNGHAALYEMAPPLKNYKGDKKYKHVVVSAATVLGRPEESLIIYLLSGAAGNQRKRTMNTDIQKQDEGAVASGDGLCVGRRYFFRMSRRTDQFAHKRYTNPECEKWQSIVVMGRVVKQRGGEVLTVIEGCGMQKPDPLDGDEIVFSAGSALTVTGGDLRTLEEHGKPDVQLGVWLH